MPTFKLGANKNALRSVDMDRDPDTGKAILSERYLRDLCDVNGQFETPYLNDALYLHFKGFEKI